MQKEEVILFLIGVFIPTGRVLVYIALGAAKITGQEVLRDYIRQHFLKRNS